MENPQKENGYTAIANEIMDALCRIRIPGEARQVLDFIIRKTYGFNKKQDAISLSQFVLGTGLKKQTVIKGLYKLKQIKLITQNGYGIANIYRINKDFSTWEPLPKKVTLPNRVTTITQLGQKRNPKRDIQKTVLKDTLTKDKEAKLPDMRKPEVQDLWDYGLTLGFGTIKQNLNRFAINRLLKGKTVEQLKKAAEFSQQIRDEAYAPQVNNWMDLEEKYLKLRDWVKRQQQPKKSSAISI